MPKTLPIASQPDPDKPLEEMAGAGHQQRTTSAVKTELNDHRTPPTTAADSSPSDEPGPAVADLDLPQLVARANQGDAAAMRELRAVLDANPEIWRRVGDLADHARMNLIRLVAEGDQLLSESLQRKAAEMEAELLGPSPSALERLSVGRVISTCMQVQHADAMTATNFENVTWARFWCEYQDRAHRRYMSAVKQLTMIRQLMPGTSGVEDEKVVPAVTAGPEMVVDEGQQADHHSEAGQNGSAAVGDGGHTNGHAHGRTNGNGDGKPDTAVANQNKATSNQSAVEHGEPVNRILAFGKVGKVASATD